MNNMEDTNIHKTNNKWIVWYHDRADKNWNIESYKDIIEINSIEDYCVLKNSWNLCLPKINEGMFFVMRNKKEYNILPKWEDKHNRNGGYWSFKIDKNYESIWFKLFACLIGESITKNVEDSDNINGISISPKKSFCIIKIWNKNSSFNSQSFLSDDLAKFLDFSTCIYAKHEINIKKYNRTRKRRYKSSYFSY